jgi:hypothetical protein
MTAQVTMQVRNGRTGGDAMRALCASCVHALCMSHGQNMPFMHAQNFPKRAWLGKIMWSIHTIVLCAEIVCTCGIAVASTLTTTKNVTF